MDVELYKILIKMAIKEARNIKNDQEALSVKMLYPDFEACEGRVLKKGSYIQYNDQLFKVIKQHTCQLTWTPTSAATLFQAVEPNHAGTQEDPIPARVNMIYNEGKFYIEDGKIYKCTRDSGIALQQLPSTLVGIYFSIV